MNKTPKILYHSDGDYVPKADYDKLKEDLKGYMMGSDAEAAAGDEARKEARELREENKKLRTRIKKLDCDYFVPSEDLDEMKKHVDNLAAALSIALPYVNISVHAPLYAEKNLNKNQSIIYEALEKYNNSRGNT